MVFCGLGKEGSLGSHPRMRCFKFFFRFTFMLFNSEVNVFYGWGGFDMYIKVPFGWNSEIKTPLPLMLPFGWTV